MKIFNLFFIWKVYNWNGLEKIGVSNCRVCGDVGLDYSSRDLLVI